MLLEIVTQALKGTDEMTLKQALLKRVLMKPSLCLSRGKWFSKRRGSVDGHVQSDCPMQVKKKKMCVCVSARVRECPWRVCVCDQCVVFHQGGPSGSAPCCQALCPPGRWTADWPLSSAPSGRATRSSCRAGQTLERLCRSSAPIPPPTQNPSAGAGLVQVQCWFYTPPPHEPA